MVGLCAQSLQEPSGGLVLFSKLISQTRQVGAGGRRGDGAAEQSDLGSWAPVPPDNTLSPHCLPWTLTWGRGGRGEVSSLKLPALRRSSPAPGDPMYFCTFGENGFGRHE